MQSLLIALTAVFTSAAAQAEAAQAAPSPVAGFLPIILIIAVFYLFIIRPQSKKFKEHKSTIEAIEKGALTAAMHAAV